MKKKPNDLIRRLVANKISREDMDIFLDGLDDEETSKIYEDYLENHFEEIMEAYQKNTSEKNQKYKR